MTTAVLVDSIAACQAAVQALLSEGEIAVDLEGVDLGRHPGKVCIIQACGKENPDTVYLFDVCELGSKGFDDGNLRELFESPSVEKVFYDVRSDTDALHHNHQVDVRNAFDLQVLYHLKFDPERSFLPGLKKTFAEFAKVQLSAGEREALEVLKAKGLRMFAPELGGSYAVWEKRPLSKLLVEYCAADVKYLLEMKALWNTAKLDSLVKEITPERILSFTRSTYILQAEKSHVDFAVPRGLKPELPAGICEEKMHIPSHKVGKVIGKGGSTIQSIQSSSGASCSLDSGVAKIRGTRAEVDLAKRMIQNLVR